jgi:hypothetical protein
VKKTLVLFAALLLVAGTFCGGKKSEPKPAAVVDLPAEAVAPLTDDAVAACVKALPGVGAALRAASFTPPQPAEDAQIANVITGFVDAMKPVAGVEDALKTAGTTWGDFRGTMLKIAAAQAAMSAEMLSGMLEEMKKDTTAEAKKSVAQIEALKNACAKVPQENKDMIQKHAKELEALKELAKEPEAAPATPPPASTK